MWVPCKSGASRIERGWNDKRLATGANIIFIIRSNSVQCECTWLVVEREKKSFNFFIARCAPPYHRQTPKSFMFVFVYLAHAIANSPTNTIFTNKSIRYLKWNASKWIFIAEYGTPATARDGEKCKPLHAMPKCVGAWLKLSFLLYSNRCGNINHRPDADNTMIKSKPLREKPTK